MRSNEYQYHKILYFKAYKYLIIKKNLTVSNRELTPTFKKVQSLASCLWLKKEKQFLAITSRGHPRLLLIHTGKLLIERATTHLPSRPSPSRATKCLPHGAARSPHRPELPNSRLQAAPAWPRASNPKPRKKQRCSEEKKKGGREEEPRSGRPGTATRGAEAGQQAGEAQPPAPGPGSRPLNPPYPLGAARPGPAPPAALSAAPGGSAPSPRLGRGLNMAEEPRSQPLGAAAGPPPSRTHRPAGVASVPSRPSRPVPSRPVPSRRSPVRPGPAPSRRRLTRPGRGPPPSSCPHQRRGRCTRATSRRTAAREAAATAHARCCRTCRKPTAPPTGSFPARVEAPSGARVRTEVGAGLPARSRDPGCAPRPASSSGGAAIFPLPTAAPAPPRVFFLLPSYRLLKRPS